VKKIKNQLILFPKWRNWIILRRNFQKNMDTYGVEDTDWTSWPIQRVYKVGEILKLKLKINLASSTNLIWTI
jgi:hypothetical protein